MISPRSEQSRLVMPRWTRLKNRGQDRTQATLLAITPGKLVYMSPERKEDLRDSVPRLYHRWESVASPTTVGGRRLSDRLPVDAGDPLPESESARRRSARPAGCVSCADASPSDRSPGRPAVNVGLSQRRGEARRGEETGMA